MSDLDLALLGNSRIAVLVNPAGRIVGDALRALNSTGAGSAVSCARWPATTACALRRGWA